MTGQSFVSCCGDRGEGTVVFLLLGVRRFVPSSGGVLLCDGRLTGCLEEDRS